jgi:hypothetical protein
VASIALDRVADGRIATWELLEPRLGTPRALERAASAVRASPSLARAARAFARPAAARRLLLASALVRAHLAANRVSEQYLGEAAPAPCASRDDTGAGASDNGSAGGGDAPDPEAVAAAEAVLRESRGVVAAAVAYARRELLPRDRELGALLQSRLAALQVLEEQLAFLDRIEEAGPAAGGGGGVGLVGRGAGGRGLELGRGCAVGVSLAPRRAAAVCRQPVGTPPSHYPLCSPNLQA